jgi:hypothetical protein
MKKWPLVLTVVLLTFLTGATIYAFWPQIYRSGSRPSAPELCFVAGICQPLPSAFLYPGRLAHRLFIPTLLKRDPIAESLRRGIRSGMVEIEYLPDHSLFEISRQGDLNKIAHQDPAQMLEDIYSLNSAQDPDPKGRENFAHDPDNLDYSNVRRGEFVISGKRASSATIDLKRRNGSHAQAFVAVCTMPFKNAFVHIYAITPGERFNLEAASQLFSLMRF